VQQDQAAHWQLRPVDRAAVAEVEDGRRQEAVFVALVEDEGVPDRVEVRVRQVAAFEDANGLDPAGPRAGALLPAGVRRAVSA
jgi:hypothetical protein